MYPKYKRAVIILFILIIAASLLSCLAGRFAISLRDIYGICTGDTAVEKADLKKHILFDIRIPRILLSMTVGAALATAGTGLQAVLKKPLASPDVLGTASASGFAQHWGLFFSGKTLQQHWPRLLPSEAQYKKRTINFLSTVLPDESHSLLPHGDRPVLPHIKLSVYGLRISSPK